MRASGGDRRRVLRAGLVMWSAIAANLVVLAGLLAAGWEAQAWGTAAGVFLMACVAVCVWSALTGEQASREVNRVAKHLQEERSRLHR